MKVSIATLSVVFAIGFVSLTAAASVTSTSKLKYECFGNAYNATIDIKMLGVDSYYGIYPLFNSTTQINFVNGRSETLKRQMGKTSPYRRLYPFGNGAYWNDDSIMMFGIGGADLGLNHTGSGLHLEVRMANPDFAKLYLGYRDARRGLDDFDKYDATCRLRN